MLIIKSYVNQVYVCCKNKTFIGLDMSLAFMYLFVSLAYLAEC